MSVSGYTVTNAALAILVLGAILGLLVWSILTQHRHAGCEEVRLRRRHLGLGVRRVPRAAREAERPAEQVVPG